MLEKQRQLTKKKSRKVPRRKKRNSTRTGNARTIRRIDQYTEADNPMVQKEMGRRTGVSQPTVSRIIDQKLDKKNIKKKMVKRLSDAVIAKRRARAKPFAELVSGKKKEFILSLDEAMLPLNFVNGQTSNCYQPKRISERNPNPPVGTSAPQFPWQIMFAAGFSWKGQTRFYHVPEKTKMNGDFFVNEVLTRIVFEDIPRLYGRDAKKVVIHMDSASSHTCKRTTDWLKENKVKYISNLQWLPNSPEVSPMDFFGNGYLKSRLQKRRYTTVEGMLAAAKEEWSEVPVPMFRKAVFLGPIVFWQFIRPVVILYRNEKNFATRIAFLAESQSPDTFSE